MQTKKNGAGDVLEEMAKSSSLERACSRSVRQTSADWIKRKVSDDIVSGRLAPGTRLEEQTLADRFHLSRTPVREAFRQLSAAGLVQVRPRKGAVVTEIDSDELRELFEALASVEYLLARFASQRMNTMERLWLQQIHDASGTVFENNDHQRYAELNHDFHSAIYQGARNRHLRSVAENLRLRLAPFRSASFRTGRRMESSIREHAAIVQAIMEEDAEAAGLALRSHIDSSSINAMRFFLQSRKERHRMEAGTTLSHDASGDGS